MLNFSSESPDDPNEHSLPLVRCPAIKSISGILLNEDLLGTNTHYYHGRTIPCDDQTCPACDDGVPWRWHFYVGLWGQSSHRTCLFEMTAKAADPLKTYRKAYGTLRGCHLTAKRVNSSPNSRVIQQATQADLQKITLPVPPDVLGALSIIWNIERPSISVAGIVKDAPKLHVQQDPQLAQPSFPSSRNTLPSPNPNGNVS